MDRRRFVGLGIIGCGALLQFGCRGKQFAQVMKSGDREMVGSHAAGGETYTPLVAEAVEKLLGRHADAIEQAQFEGGNPPPLRICFVGVENRSAEELGDFKDQIYQAIDSKVMDSQIFSTISRRMVDAGLRQNHLRPDDLFIPEHQRTFAATLEQQGQPFDFLLFANLTSGTTRENQNYQRDYQLTLELVNINTGETDKQSATLSKAYHQTRLGRLTNNLRPDHGS